MTVFQSSTASHPPWQVSEAFGDRFILPQTVRKLVEAGHLGRKSGQGFYSYDKRG